MKGREDIQVHLIRSKRKSISLEIKPDLTVNLRVPSSISKREAEIFLNNHRKWLEEKYEVMRQRRLMAKNQEPDVQKLIKAEKERAKEIFADRAAYYSELMGVTYGRITVRQQKTRWGSCSSLGNLNFNIKLIIMPSELLDYVVVHELAHRKQMNHSEKFWREVEKILPDYRQRRARLKQYAI